MMQRELGRTGIKVSPIGLGAMPLSLHGRPSAEQAVAVIKAFIDGGGTLIDTANAYCLDHAGIGHNERLIRDCLVRLGVRDQILVATKGGLTRPDGRWDVDGRPAWIRSSCEQSLRDLGVTCIDLYQLHAIDPKVPFADTLGELIRLQQEGKIRHLGLSNVRAEQLELALRQTVIVSVQNRCNPFETRDFSSGFVDLCRLKAITYIAHSPVGGHSRLASRPLLRRLAAAMGRRSGHGRLGGEPLLSRLASKYDSSVYCIALAWLLAKGEHILPIPGASRVSSIRDSLRATAVKLVAEDVRAIDGLSAMR